MLINDWKHSKGWFVSNDIRLKIYHDLEIEISDKQITDILKNDLRKSYKKGSARPASLSSRKHSLTQKLYAAEFINLWKSNYLYINIDEVLFSNKTKFNYSWLNRGASGSLQNTIFKGSKSIIAAISSTGKWLISELNCKNNSDFFIKFLHKLERWVVFDLKMKLNDTIIIMDNSSIHKSWKTLDFIRKSNAIYSFLPAYAPELAPIELFFNTIKRRLTMNKRNTIINLSEKNAMKELKEILASVNEVEILCFWRKTFSKLSMFLRES